MIIREHYLKQIRPFYESDLIKIITGIRRCGKSVILKQVLNELEAAGKKCLFLDFDQRPVRANILIIPHVQITSSGVQSTLSALESI